MWDHFFSFERVKVALACINTRPFPYERRALRCVQSMTMPQKNVFFDLYFRRLRHIWALARSASRRFFSSCATHLPPPPMTRNLVAPRAEAFFPTLLRAAEALIGAQQASFWALLRAAGVCLGGWCLPPLAAVCFVFLLFSGLYIRKSTSPHFCSPIFIWRIWLVCIKCRKRRICVLISSWVKG